jgi:hypothetical protein
MTRTIDVHHHILPDFFYLETNDPIAPVGGIEPPHWSVDMMMRSGSAFLYSFSA